MGLGQTAVLHAFIKPREMSSLASVDRSGQGPIDRLIIYIVIHLLSVLEPRDWPSGEEQLSLQGEITRPGQEISPT